MSLHQHQESQQSRITQISKEYAEFVEVFKKAKATQQPPHCPWDCAIEVLPNTAPPKSTVYPLSLLAT